MKENPIIEIKERKQVELTIDLIVETLKHNGSNALANIIEKDKPFTVFCRDADGLGYVGIDFRQPMIYNMSEYKKKGGELLTNLIKMEGYDC